MCQKSSVPQAVSFVSQVLKRDTVTVKVAHVRLWHSRMLFVRAYPRETQESANCVNF